MANFPKGAEGLNSRKNNYLKETLGAELPRDVDLRGDSLLAHPQLRS